MTNEFERARRDLDSLPSSVKKTHALQLLDEIENGERETAKALSKLEATLAKLAPSSREQRMFQILPWVVVMIALLALYSGIDAIWNAEYCARGRSGVSCSHGITAQLQGAATLVIAVLLAVIPVPASKIKKAACWLLGLVCTGLIFASLLVR
jgi:hypothetical protein